jgi:metallophosphoesterase superfamily enzyme
MLILNDVHIGVQRKGGTTPASQEALRTYLFTQFDEALTDTKEKHVCILGDLFDEFEVAPRDWLQAYLSLSDFLVRTMGKLTLVAGNHDHSAKALKVSSFEMLCSVLEDQYGPDLVKIVGIDHWKPVEPNVYALAHCSNQDIFNLKLDELLDITVSGDRILLHANYDNNFAAVSDHSLNVTVEQAKAFHRKGATLYFAHEHQARTCMAGGVVIFGNQWPTSVADCLNNDYKYAHIMSGGLTKVETWGHGAEAGYEQVPWDILSDYPVDGGAGFIRVFGEATSSQAGEVISAIAKFRSRSSAFVITNGVKVDGILAAEALPESFEAAKTFDVMSFIKDNLTAEEYEVVETLRA